MVSPQYVLMVSLRKTDGTWQTNKPMKPTNKLVDKVRPKKILFELEYGLTPDTDLYDFFDLFSF